MFGTSGIRGPVGEAVTASLSLSIGHALGIDADRVVVGRDTRESGAFLLDALAAGLRESGVDVVDIGVAATPTIARAVGWEDADAGVAITASHNPARDNGLKLWQPSGQAFDEARREVIAGRIGGEERALVTWEELGARTNRSWRRRHRDAIVDAVSPAEPLSVVVDVGNGAGGVTIDALDALGCAIETLNAQEDGRFPGRPSEPTASNCESLARVVEGTDADLGIAHDGDADRLQAVTADGEFLSGDVLLAVFARNAAAAGDEVAVPVDTSLAVEDYLADAGIGTTLTPVGDVYVAEAATDPDVTFGGEPSGAWIWPAETRCPDGPLAAGKLVELAAERPLADRAAEVETYPIQRTSIEVTEKAVVMSRVRELVQQRYDSVSTLDGVRVDLGDAWFLVRASGTEPKVRVTAEAREADRTMAVFEDARSVVEEATE